MPEVKLSSADRVLFPADGITKGDLMHYYATVAKMILPAIEDRPLILKRYPNGIEKPFFFQKAVAPSFPKWLRTEIADDIRYVIGSDRATLLFLVNLGCIDHNPWMSRMDSLENPDYLLIDLDPQGNASTALGIEHGVGTPSIYDVLLGRQTLAEVVTGAEFASAYNALGGPQAHVPFTPLPTAPLPVP